MSEGEKILPVSIEDEMQKSYLDYSMSMITARALPDVRDGLKPVHRRVLFGMQELGLEHSKPTKKSARVVGDVIGKYHPHGDAAVYDAMVRLAQNFSMRYPMIEGQGNFGSIDGDPPAAMRYTECRLTELAEEMLSDLDKETVEFVPNYDDSLREPTVLPAKVPFLLINGSTGIAVGMTTNMAPHNLGEVVDAIVAFIDNPDIALSQLLHYIPGPDFPTGSIIYGRSGIVDAYRTGKGKIVIRAKAEIEKLPQDREQIVITEIPYLVCKTALLEKMGELVREKQIEGVSFIRDESDRSGMRIVIGVKKENFAEVVLNQLYKFTALQSTFGIINLALVDRRPKRLSLKELIRHFIDHRFTVVTRRAQFELRKALERAHILEGLRIALDHIDAVVSLIRASASTEEAQSGLMTQFGLSEIQAKAILDMRLQRLTGLEREKIETEYRQTMSQIESLTALLNSTDQRMALIKQELLDLKQRFADPRRTLIVEEEGDLEVEDMIANEPMVITMSHAGYIKRCALSTYRSQGRGGKGIRAMDSKEDDFIQNLFIAMAHSSILFFTNLGRCYWLKVYKIPEAPRYSRGKPIVNLLDLRSDEKIAAFVPLRNFEEFPYIIFATKKGIINKQPLSAYAHSRKDGLNAIHLDADDTLIECRVTRGNDEIILASKKGKAVRFHESATRELGRNTRGMKGIELHGDDEVVGMIVVKETDLVLTVTDKGYGKKTPVCEYRKTNRGGSGVINIKCTEKTGNVVGLKGVRDDSDLMLITRKGIVIRIDVAHVSTIGRNTQGVRLMNLENGDSVIDVALCEKARELDEQDDASAAEKQSPCSDRSAAQTTATDAPIGMPA